ncbi:hypothetical protein BaRGS_00039043 [Batillaria attramentaria]|uniref:Nanos-type domain-containing protein n=1 Tax=Batillaria attramentaria TaxID=370345 RepID=A0ABD0J412_9CAEN
MAATAPGQAETEAMPVRRKKRLCKFCKKNNEAKVVYESHNLRDKQGRVVCRKLRQLTCRLCGATGDDAHTIKYCPLSDLVDHAAIMKLRREIEMDRMMKNRRRYTRKS